MRSPKIKSLFRFKVFLSILIICLLALFYSLLVNSNTVYLDAADAAQGEYYVVHIVEPGDTVSGLYDRYQNDQYMPGEWDEAVFRLNDMKDYRELGNLQPGQRLKLPKWMMK